MAIVLKVETEIYTNNTITIEGSKFFKGERRVDGIHKTLPAGCVLSYIQNFSLWSSRT